MSTVSSNASSDYPAERLGNTNKVAAAVQEVIGSGETTAAELSPLAVTSATTDRATPVPAPGPASDEGQRGASGADAMREQAAALGDTIVAYTRSEPVKALMIAAVAGAFAVTLLGSLTRSSR